MVKGFTYRPSDKAIDMLISESENKNSNMEHYKLIALIRMENLSKQDCSYETKKLLETNEWGRMVHKLVHKDIREVNKEITVNHIRWFNINQKKKEQDISESTNYHLRMLTKLLKEVDFTNASIHFWSLPKKHQEKLKQSEENIVKEFFKELAVIEEEVKQWRGRNG